MGKVSAQDAMQPSGASGKPKVFGIGLGRTGTTSLTHALTILGYRTVHFPVDEASRREITEYLERKADRIEMSVLADHDALTDVPVCCIYQGLDQAYPGSRFILTTRDKESWLASTKRFWDQIAGPLTSASPDAVEAQFGTYIARKLEERTIGRAVDAGSGRDDGATYDRELMAKFYDAYHQEVRDYFNAKPEQLLTLNIIEGEGWEQLAPFLGERIPDEPFPSEFRLNRPGESGNDLGAGSAATAEDVAVVEAYLAAFRKRDIESCQRFFNEDALVKFMAKRFQGSNAIREWHRERFDANVTILDVKSVAPVNDTVVADMSVTSKLLKRWRVKLAGLVVIRLNEAKIQEMGFEGVRLGRQWR